MLDKPPRDGPIEEARTNVRAFCVQGPSFLLALALLVGCHEVPRGESAIDQVRVNGLARREHQEVLRGIATQGSAKFLGVFGPGVVFEYELYDELTLSRDLERIERLLRRRGYYEAKVRAARIVRLKEDHVRVEIEVDEGERVVLRKVETQGLSALPFDASIAALRANPLRAGEVFDEDVYEDAKVSISNALADVGYAHVRTRGRATVDLRAHAADVVLEVEPGPLGRYGKVTIEGLSTVPEGPVRSALLGVKEGHQYSRRDLELARAALFDLGVFSRVEVVPDLKDPKQPVIDVKIRVDEAPLRNITAGIGASLDVLRLAANGRLGWSHLNFLGGLRKLSITTSPTLTFFPTRVDRWDNLRAPVALLPENSLLVSLEQPSFLEGRTRGFLNSAYNVYPLLYPLATDADPTRERIIGYNEVTVAAGARRNLFGRVMPVSLSMNFRSDFPFAYQRDPADARDLPEGLGPVVVTYPELLTDLDLRDDPIAPTKGLFFSNSLQVAVPFAPNQPSDVRLRPEVRAYVPLDYGRRLILAARATFGFVFPQNYGKALTDPDALTTPAQTLEDQHRLLFRAFYSGGPQSNRGYPFQRIGPQGPIGFLVPTGENCNQDPLPSQCTLPLGGFSLWEASLELRWSFAPPWGLVLFADASDVNPRVLDISFDTPHISIGPGLRYQSPVGPVRVDLGFRVPGLQKLSSSPESPPDISETPPYLGEEWYNAFALQVLIGEAF